MMFISKKFIALALFSLSIKFGYSQSSGNAGWFFLSNTHQLSQKIDVLTDVQLRSATKFDYINTLLVRGALSYDLNKQHSVAYIADLLLHPEINKVKTIKSVNAL